MSSRVKKRPGRTPGGQKSKKNKTSPPEKLTEEFIKVVGRKKDADTGEIHYLTEIRRDGKNGLLKLVILFY